MRNAILFLGVIIFIFSCKKTNTSDTGCVTCLCDTCTKTDTTHLYGLSSMKQYSNRLQIDDSLGYDTSHRLTSILVLVYDTTSGSPQLTVIKVAYSYTGNETVPNGFAFYYPVDQSDNHDIFYDNQNREIEDSTTNDPASALHMTYPTNEITLSWPEANNLLDTLYLTNGNVTLHNEYQSNMLYYSIQFTYSSYANPAYSDTIANTIGGWIDVWIRADVPSFLDFVSPNLPSSVSEVGSGLLANNAAINFTWTTDSKGRVVKGTLPLPGNTTTILYSYY